MELLTGPTLGASRCGVMEILGQHLDLKKLNFKQTNVSVHQCNKVDIYGKKEAGTGEHLTHLIK